MLQGTNQVTFNLSNTVFCPVAGSVRVKVKRNLVCSLNSTWGGCIIYLTYLLLKKVVAYVYEVQAATGKMFDQNVSYIEMSPELSEIPANINQLKQETESNARLAKENEQRKNDLIMYLAHDLKTPLSSVIGYLS